MDIHELAKRLEKMTGNKPVIHYGDEPPMTPVEEEPHLVWYPVDEFSVSNRDGFCHITVKGDSMLVRMEMPSEDGEGVDGEHEVVFNLGKGFRFCRSEEEAS